jgi:hypothetical protein
MNKYINTKEINQKQNTKIRTELELQANHFYQTSVVGLKISYKATITDRNSEDYHWGLVLRTKPWKFSETF